MQNSKRNSQTVDWAKEIIDWARSEEGKRQLQDADRDSLKAIKELRQALVIDNEMLHTSFTL